MNNFIKGLIGMEGMTDQVVATDLLISAKSGVINTSLALTEAATPALRSVLKEQLFAALRTHENISKYMIAKGYYHPYELSKQIQVDLQTAQTAQDLAQN